MIVMGARRMPHTAAMKREAPAAQRNREPIRAVLERVVPARGTVLEIAAGSGEHAVHFARAFPQLTWQPSDPDPAARASIAAWRDEAQLPNLAAPVELDVMAPWPLDRADAVVCINMIHISPWEASIALFDGAARLLAPGALLFTYGPYRLDGVTAPSNEAFDQSLRSRDPRWGVREVGELATIATGFELAETVAMPANNHSLIWRRR
jgi:SAM-dependent methyltransferase